MFNCLWGSHLGLEFHFVSIRQCCSRQFIQLTPPNGQHCHIPSNFQLPRRLPQLRGAQGPECFQGDLLQGWAKRGRQPSAVHLPLIHINELLESNAVRKTNSLSFSDQMLNFNSQTYHKVTCRLYSNKGPSKKRPPSKCVFSTELHTEPKVKFALPLCSYINWLSIDLSNFGYISNSFLRSQ